MKLIKKSVTMDPETFQPLLEATFAFSLEAVQDASVLDVDQIYYAIGKDLVDLLTNKETTQ